MPDILYVPGEDMHQKPLQCSKLVVSVLDGSRHKCMGEEMINSLVRDEQAFFGKD